tara:strand:- start:327 stop:788 length:462 start_codon:yes stop_codon:yes gene_type:complete
MSELRDLYQEVILDHGKSPRNFGKLESKTADAHGHNPLCGDTITIYLELDKDVIKDISFEGRGCAISLASASLMTGLLKGRNIDDAQVLFAHFHKLVSDSNKTMNVNIPTDDLQKLDVLAGVRDYPMRVKCATLAWHTFNAALQNNTEEVTTE